MNFKMKSWTYSKDVEINYYAHMHILSAGKKAPHRLKFRVMGIKNQKWY